MSEKSTRPIILYWGVRSEADLYMSELAETWVAEQSNITFIPVLSDAGEDWAGRTCGPPAMIQAAEQTFQEKGMNKDQFFYDSFDFSNDQ